MSLTREQVKGIAHLARIALDESQLETAQAELNPVFALIEQMQALDTQGVAPLTHAQDLTQRLRPDEVRESDRHEAFLALAPETEQALFLVPKVIE